MPAVHIRTHDMLNPLERQFLEAAEKGNMPVLGACLAKQVRGKSGVGKGKEGEREGRRRRKVPKEHKQTKNRAKCR